MSHLVLPPPCSARFEVVVLIAVLHLHERAAPAYGSSIRDEIRARANRPRQPRGAIYVTLDRLEQKQLLASHLTGAEPLARWPAPAAVQGDGALDSAPCVRRSNMVNRLQAGLEPLWEKR
jgi:hypothetical protein